MSQKPLRATDKRKAGRGTSGIAKGVGGTTDTNGAGPALHDIFNDRRTYQNGKGKKAN